MMVSSAFSMLRVLLVSACGVIAAKFPKPSGEVANTKAQSGSAVRPLLHPDARRDVGRVCITLCWPCLAITSIGAAVHTEDLARVWPLLIWCFVQNLVALGICKVVTRFLSLDPVMETVFCLAGSFGNSAALPMLMMKTLCNSSVLAPRFADESECLAQSYASIMVFSAAWSVGMFAVAIPATKRAAARAARVAKLDQAADPELTINQVMGKPQTGPQSGGSGALAGRPSSVTLGAAVTVVDEAEEPWLQTVCHAMLTPNILSVLLGLGVGLCKPLSDGLFRDEGVLRAVGGAFQTLAEPGVCGMTLVMAAALVPAPGSRKEQTRLPVRLIVSLCLLKLVLIPAVGFALVLAVMRAGVLPRVDAAQWLIVFVQWGVPSSQTAVVVLATLQMHTLAQKLASVYLFMYPLSIATLTGWTTLALYLVRENM